MNGINVIIDIIDAYILSRVDTEKRLDNVGRVRRVSGQQILLGQPGQEAGGESSALLFRALYAVPFPTHSLSTFETGVCVVFLEKAYFEMKVK